MSRDRASFLRRATPGSVVPVWRELLADVETPFSAYCKLRHGAGMLLESVERGDRVGRYSYVATDLETLAVSPGDDAFDAVRRGCAVPCVGAPDANLPPFVGGVVGYLGYELAGSIEPTVPRASRVALDVPDAMLLRVDSLLAFDHVRQRIVAIANVAVSEDPAADYDRAQGRLDAICARLDMPLIGETPAPQLMTDGDGDPFAGVSTSMSPAAYCNMVEVAKQHIAHGEAIQIVVSQRFERRTTARPLDLYRALRTVTPAPYTFLLEFERDEDVSIVGASPELLVQVRGGTVTTHPIAGTRPRGATRNEDDLLERELLADEKERAEHVMLVDLGRNDLGRVCEVGSVDVPTLMRVERYSHVMHIVSHVTGRLRSGVDAVDALRACFPAGTVSGAPKVRAMQLIAELEGEARGPYAGAIVCAGGDGSLDAAIAIRCITLHAGTATVQTGAGVVADSVPMRELEETRSKARGMLLAISLAERIARTSSNLAPDTSRDPSARCIREVGA